MKDSNITWKEHFFRYLGLFFICMITLGGYYIYDVPSALSQDVIDSWYNVSQFKYSLFYTVYNFPCTAIILFGGYFIDTVFGIKLGILIFSGLITLGQILFAISSNLHYFWLALLGRSIFGLGGDTLTIAQSMLISIWFEGRSDYNFAFAIPLAFSRLGSAMNFQITPILLKKYNLPATIWFGAFCCCLSFVSSIVMCFLETARIRKDKTEIKMGKPFCLKDIKQFPKAYWIICVFIICYYVPLFTFIPVGTQFLKNKFSTSDTLASTLISIPYFTAVPSPLIGFMIDRVGRHYIWMGSSIVLMLIAHAILGFTMLNPYIGMIIMGLSYSIMCASIWPTFPALIPSSCLGTAYGIAALSDGLSITLMGLLVNAILDKTHNNYKYIFSIFIAFLIIGIFLVVILIIIDSRERAVKRKEQNNNINLKKEQNNNITLLKSNPNDNDDLEMKVPCTTNNTHKINEK